MKITYGSKLTEICSLKWLYHEIFNKIFKKTKKIETHCCLKHISSLPYPILSSIFVFYIMQFSAIIVVFNLCMDAYIHTYLGLQCPNSILRWMCPQKLGDNCSRKPFLTLLFVPVIVTGPSHTCQSPLYSSALPLTPWKGSI